MIDTHCHVHDPQYDADRDATIARARAAGVVQMVTVGEDVKDSARALETARSYGISAAVGVHPHEAKDAPGDLAAAFDPLLADPLVVAIGETGLDYYYDHSPRDRQANVLRAQLTLARKRRKPLIFHQRDAFEDFVAILREQWSPAMRGIVHCFTGDAEQARTLVGEFDLLLGIGGVVTFPKADALREAVRTVGAQALVLETDCPYLAPVPMRGKRNEPAFLQYTAPSLAQTLGISQTELVAVTDRNAAKLFGLKMV